MCILLYLNSIVIIIYSLLVFIRVITLFTFFIAVVGCYAQLKPEEIANIPGVNVVLGANEKFNILDYLDKQPSSGKAHIENGHIKEVKTFIPSYSANDRTRTFLKIQDGCDYFCSFCTIPLARGRSRNQGIEETLKVLSSKYGFDKGS